MQLSTLHELGLSLGRSRLLGTFAALMVLVPVLASCDSGPTEVTPVATVEVAPSTGSVLVGGTLQLVATIADAGGTTLTDRPVAWASTDEAIASVSALGLVTGVGEGSATITATSDGVSATATVDVAPAPAATVEVSPSPASVMVGMMLGLTAVPKDAGGNELSGRMVAWASSNDAVVTVSASGVARGVGEGSATLSATVEGRSGTATVSVTPFGVSSLSPGAWTTCGVAAGEAFCWGTNYYGELGTGASGEEERLVPTRVAGGLSFASVTTGRVHTCGVATDGQAYCWGRGDSGVLGDGSGISMSVPVPVQGGLTFVSVTAGDAHNCGLTSSGEAYCWGKGPLGNGSSTATAWPTAVSGWLKFRMIDAGGGHVCGVTTGGDAYCWGPNGLGKLGNGEQYGYWMVPVMVSGGLTFSSVSAGDEHTCGLTTAGEAYCWGKNREGQLGDGTEEARTIPTQVSGGLIFAEVHAGMAHSCGRTTEGGAYCWGRNGEGQLGDGTTEARLAPTMVSGGMTFATVITGERHSCATALSGATYCWGWGIFGQLGSGVMGDVLVPTQISPPG